MMMIQSGSAKTQYPETTPTWCENLPEIIEQKSPMSYFGQVPNNIALQAKSDLATETIQIGDGTLPVNWTFQ